MFNPGETVRYTYDNSTGEITGQTRASTGGTLWQVRFTSGRCKFIPERYLEPAVAPSDIWTRFSQLDFSGISELRRTMYQYRLSGKLTNLIYSMNNNKAQFFAHQFIPVTKFLESYGERLLIADEVGLGKTIEAMYIWEEIKARYNARRLLIVVPAILREKWKGDLEKYFDIDARIVSPQSGPDSLLETLRQMTPRTRGRQFALIVSLEGFRIADEVRNIMVQNSHEHELFDLAIIDEAHSLRNSETESFKSAEQLRDVASRLLLLSATPIQTNSKNFFNLLNLLSPEDFFDEHVFEERLEENRPLVKLSNALEGYAGGDLAEIKELLQTVVDNPVFAADSNCQFLRQHLDEIVPDTGRRIDMISTLKEKYFYSNYLTRTRRRDVSEDRPLRNVKTIEFHLNDYEKSFYDKVTSYLRKQRGDGNEFTVFRLIARQRQMTSCMAGALDAWRKQRRNSDIKDDSDVYRYEIWSIEGKNGKSGNSTPSFMPEFNEFDVDELERCDSKFNHLLKTLRGIFAMDSSERIVIFTFFRHTAKYLQRRLSAAGIKCNSIMGGINPEEKMLVLDGFKSGDFNVLVSTEVGAEGIDLQFARYEINYDLPWNPMKLEQRIGRIDRIGQKSKQIFIYNAFCQTTIEDRVLSSLYRRFEQICEVIGDMEEILGNVVKGVEINVFNNDHLSDEQISEIERLIDNAIENKKRVNLELEQAAGNLTAYQKYVLDNISRAHENLRHVTPEELHFTIKDFLNSRFPGSSVMPYGNTPSFARIRLSPVARNMFLQFLDGNHDLASTGLTAVNGDTVYSFGRNNGNTGGTYVEDIDVSHPIVKWILSVLNSDNPEASCCASMTISKSDLPASLDISPGMYSFIVHNWTSNGYKKKNELHYFAASSTGRILDSSLAEQLVVHAMQYGGDYNVRELPLEAGPALIDVLNILDDKAEDDFDAFCQGLETQNENLIEEQKKYIVRIYDRRVERTWKTIDDLRTNGKDEGVIRMFKGKIPKIEEIKKRKIEELDANREVFSELGEVAIGILEVR